MTMSPYVQKPSHSSRSPRALRVEMIVTTGVAAEGWVGQRDPKPQKLNRSKTGSIEANVEYRSRKSSTAFVSPVAEGSKPRQRAAHRSGWIVGGLIVGTLALGTSPVRGQGVCVSIGNACQPADPNDCTEEDPGPCCVELQACPPEDSCCDDDPTQLCCPCAGIGEFPDSITPLIPLTDFNNPDYLGTYELGLYSENSASKTNTVPAGHKTLALKKGTLIVPRAQNGIADPADGLIAMVSMGFSNVNQEFKSMVTSKIEPLTGDLDGINDRLVFVNGAKGGTEMCDWEEIDLSDPLTNPWGSLVDENGLILQPGRQPGMGTQDITVFASQVQVVWMKMLIRAPWLYCQESSTVCDPVESCALNLCGDPNPACDDEGCRFPNWVFGTDGEVEKYKTILQNIREVFPNVQQVYISSRTYAGWSNEVDGAVDPVPTPCGEGNPEPWAYQTGFTIQKLMQEQIYAGTMPFGPTGTFPLILWGAYLWSNGVTSNAIVLPYESASSLAALNWPCEKSCADGQHPSTDASSPGQTSGRQEVANRLYAFFKNDDIAKEWFLERPLIMSSDPIAGFEDPLDDRDWQTGTIPHGISQVSIQFDKAVRDIVTEAALTTASFQITSTGGSPPTIQTVTDLGNNEYRLTLSGPIEPGQWTTILPQVEDNQDNPLRNDPWDRIDLAFLPGDVTLDFTTNLADYTMVENCLLNPTCAAGAPLERVDVNRNGTFDGGDRNREQKLLQGINTTQVWNNVSLPPRP